MRVIVSCACVMLAIGCGPAAPTLAPVTGKITVDGKPLPRGLVSFESVDKGFAATATIQDGAYTLASQFGNGLPVGKYKVAVTPPKIDPGKPGNPVKDEASPIPLPYRSIATSPLTAEVRAGTDRFNFDLN